jgi:hypothetical protein
MTTAAYMRRRRLEGPSLRNQRLLAAPLLALLSGIETGSKRLNKTIWRAQRSGWISVAAADELCVVLLRRHPAEVYGDEWFEGGA